MIAMTMNSGGRSVLAALDMGDAVSNWHAVSMQLYTYGPVGAVVTSQKDFVTHPGVLSDRFDSRGYQTVVHNSPRVRGVAETSMEHFASNGTFWIREVPTSRDEGHRIVARARQWLGRPYNLFTSNCEHLVEYACRGVPASPQLQVAVGATAFLALLYLANQDRA